MKPPLLFVPLLFSLSQLALAEPRIEIERLEFGSGFAFNQIPVPAKNDVGTAAQWRLESGTADSNGGKLAVLHDGLVPAGDDSPRENFFFAASTDGGSLSVDLGKPVTIERVGTFSRHNGSRAPQVYSLHGFANDEWKKLADVDTREKGRRGGRHGVAITDASGQLGEFSKLRFDIRPTDKRDRFGLTFFSEIDVVAAGGEKLDFVDVGKPAKVIRFGTEDKKYSFVLDATEAPEFLEWSAKELAPVVIAWYPKLVALLPSKGYEAPTAVTFQYRNDLPAGVPAYASGSSVKLNAPWFKNQLKREAKGCVIHELVHVVQNYWRARLVNRNAKPTPSWLTEGIADYVRWFLYEPEKRGALMSPARLAKARHDASYRVTANFIDWVARNYDGKIAEKLNSAAREGRYEESLWKEFTSREIGELAAEWRAGKER
ncbi:MAG: hypothetical protein ACI8XO_003178 [Verrucomicrobiales bacterium]|jgi:hypothetical protein